MDEQARRSARTRAAIAFGLAGVLLVVNVAAAVAWREERRERFGDRIGFERGGDRDGQWRGPVGPGDRMAPDGMPGVGQDGQGGRDDGQQVGPNRPGAGRPGQGGRAGQGDGGAQGGTSGQDDTDGQDGTA